MQLRQRLPTASASTLVAGGITTLVGVVSSAALVFQAARALGAGPAEIASWILALGVGIGVTSIALSLRYRAPVVLAWSTPGAALLATSGHGVSMSEAVGAFLLAAALTVVVGLTGWFERAVDLIPASIAAALLGGVLLQFGIGVFTTMQDQFWLVAAMLAGYLLGKRLQPRYAVLIALVVGVALAGAQGSLRLGGVEIALAAPVWVWPSWSLHTTISIAIPLFVITMTSQNLPGVVTLRTHGYSTPVSPLLSWTGAVNVVLAPLGCFGINLAAITAALCMGRDAHEDPAQRYKASIASGVCYVLLGIFGATLGSLIAAFPLALITALAGIGLLDTIGGSLAKATEDADSRTAALIAFLVTASGLTVFGIASVFWGLVAGVAAHLITRRRS
ncbi:benzoate membrane transport protein [Saccharopolyspora antimicrobica]|uniref:Benzoate membrane transport protein n=1 Tax=Saccharopolyspora antimicrobica TaxID=455193 RepID=A0A1I5FEL0_9PSEU|nr:benzoate/H(+) symporter BenE family transporter [Saccharopolyspora antimicrobica]RKT82095.1 benzoate membrane transport protein [Saccharopolyspora antimicrobica]SFO22069.1 benzoate membrane transport protein [Saccharopolyspora antimicrobica]